MRYHAVMRQQFGFGFGYRPVRRRSACHTLHYDRL